MTVPMTGRSAAAGDPFYERLVGCWRLLRWESIGEDGSVELPMGEVPEGLLAYTPDGTMVTNIGRSGRPPISAGDLLEGPADERLAAFATYIAYAARVALEGETVIHEVVMSLYPNWVGSRQRRHASISGDDRTLVLTADPFPMRGRVSTQRLTWEKVG